MLNIHKKKAMVSLNATSRKGFTFVELVVVIAVLAVLLAVLAPSLLSYVELSRMQKDDSTMDEVVNAVQLAITDSATFDEVYSYCIPNNYVTYTDSSGKYANRTMDEEFWAPDGSGAAVTITFNPENGKYNISEGIVNDMTFGNGSVAEKRTAEGVQQCYLYEMGKSLLYSNVKQTIGNSVKERSATYKNSSYTVFIRFKIVDGTRQADVYGLFNGTNLSEGCPAAIGSNTSSYDEENKPISTTPSGGHQNSKFTNTDLSGSGSLGGFGPNKPLPTYRQCKNGHTFDETNPILTERCICTVCYVTEHKFHETGTIMKCERCGYVKEHNCNGNPCPLCGAIPFKVTAENREKVGFTGEENENLVIPETFVDTDGQRYRVVSIGNFAFQDCGNLAGVKLPNSITTLGWCAFDGCINLTKVSIPDSVTILGDAAFGGCTNLRNVTIGNSVTSIGVNAFSGCSKLSSINIPDSVTQIKNSAFNNCSSLASISIPNNVTHLGNSVFSGCSSLASISMPDSLKGIGIYVFNGCSSLKSVNLPNGITTIPDGTFASCSSLNSVYIPASITRIGGASFRWCTSLTSIEIPDSVMSIGNNAFDGCNNLTSINIPDGVTSIGNYAFTGCGSLISISIPDGVTNIGRNAFQNCSNLTNINIPDGITVIQTSTFQGCENLASINIPNGVTSIGGYAFLGCHNLPNVDIPESVTNVGVFAFSSCSNITSITIPDGVTSIEDCVFQSSHKLTSISIPSSVTRIGRSFDYCGANLVITFRGKKEQWHSIEKVNSNWKYYAPSFIVRCTDGDIPKADA